MPASPWSKPPGLPCRRSRRQSHTIPSCAGVPTPSGPHACALHLKPPPPVEQAARLAMPAVTPAEQHTRHTYGVAECHPARTTAHSTSTRRLSPHLRVLRVLRGLPSPCSLWFVFSVPSVSCPMCGRLSSRPWSPSPTALLHPIAAAKWSKPPDLPCRRSRRQSHTIPNAAGVPTPSVPHDCALHLNPPPLSPSPCPPCSLWFVFSVPSVSCPMWDRLSSVGPAFQPAWAPFTHRPFSSPLHARPKFSL